MVWLCLKVFWFSKVNPTGHGQGKRKRGIQKKRWEDKIKEWTGMDFASSTRAAENRTRWKEIVANSFVVPRRTSNVWDRIEIENRSFVKTAESYEASLVTINRQTSYDWCPSSRLKK